MKKMIVSNAKPDTGLEVGEEQVISTSGVPDLVLVHVSDGQWVCAVRSDWDMDLRDESYDGIDEDGSKYYFGQADYVPDSRGGSDMPWSVEWLQDYGMGFGEQWFDTENKAIEYMVKETIRLIKAGELLIAR